jgi:hypothetical protein
LHLRSVEGMSGTVVAIDASHAGPLPLVDRALDPGVKYIDTSSIYGGPARWSEQSVTIRVTKAVPSAAMVLESTCSPEAGVLVCAIASDAAAVQQAKIATCKFLCLGIVCPCPFLDHSCVEHLHKMNAKSGISIRSEISYCPDPGFHLQNPFSQGFLHVRVFGKNVSVS